MQYIDNICKGIKGFFTGAWNMLSLFFGFPYEEQAKRLGDWDIRGDDNPKREYTAYRANKVSK